MIRRLLVREGHTVVMADNGAIAVDLFKAHSSEFDCILLDVCMPVCDGVQACRLIRELEMKRNRMSDTAMTPTPAPAQGSSALPYSLTLERGETEPLPNRVERIPIVAVTASALLDDKRACVDAGMSVFDRMELLLAACVAHRRSHLLTPCPRFFLCVCVCCSGMMSLLSR